LALEAAHTDTDKPQGTDPAIEHINFWRDEEISNAKAQHPEVEVGRRLIPSTSNAELQA